VNKVSNMSEPHSDDANGVYSAVLEETQKRFEEWCKKENVNFKLLVVAGETMCTCGPPAYDSSLFVCVRKPSDSAELAEHHRLKHQLRPRFTLSKPYVVAPWNVLDAAYQNWRAYPDKYWQFEEDYPGAGGTYFVLSPVRFNKKRTLAIASAYRKCAIGLMVESWYLWRRTRSHLWEPHYLTRTTRLDELGFS
jgi:hypothetical protein